MSPDSFSAANKAKNPAKHPTSSSEKPLPHLRQPKTNAGISRRALITTGAALTRGLLLTGFADAPSKASPASAYPVAGLDGTLVATDLEVTTVTTNSVTFTWATYDGPHTSYGELVPARPANTEVRMAPLNAHTPLKVVHYDSTPRGFHHITITGLKPGTSYRFECRSNNTVAEPGLLAMKMPTEPTSTGIVTTLTPPPGRYIDTLAFTNDTHIGESEHGLITKGFPPPIQQLPGRPPYPKVMLAGTLMELRHRGIRHVFVNGDCTSEARPIEVADFCALMDTFGTYNKNWFVTRGNHDRPHTPDSDPSAHYEKYPVLPGTEDHRDPWGARLVPHQKAWETRIGAARIIGIDSTHLDLPGGVISPEQFTQLRQMLKRDPHRPTILMCHHPVTSESAFTNAAGPTFVLNRQDATTLQGMLADTPGAFLMLAGHTHRAKRVSPDDAKNVDFVELPAVKDNPGGYTLVRFYTGGYQLNFYRTSTPGALEWASRCRWAGYGFNAEATTGKTSDRNYVRRCDLSRLASW